MKTPSASEGEKTRESKNATRLRKMLVSVSLLAQYQSMADRREFD